MCNYNSVFIKKSKKLKLREKEKALIDLDRKMQNGFEYKDWPIIKAQGDDDWCLEMAHWEFVPYWIKSDEALKESRKKFTTLNATSERLLESKMFRDAAIKRRCIVLSSGFYEWRHLQPIGAKKPIAYPYFITTNTELDMPLFMMAGIYQPTVDFSTGEVIDSFSIVTTAANSLMEQIHNKKKRMPTILTHALAEEWIQEGLSESRIHEIASFQLNSSELKAWNISKDFRTADYPLEEYRYEELPELIINSNQELNVPLGTKYLL